jgi:hypothetical protein
VSNKNMHVRDAPVSFPPIWTVPWFRWMQYDASARRSQGDHPIPTEDARHGGVLDAFVDNYEGENDGTTVADEWSKMLGQGAKE